MTSFVEVPINTFFSPRGGQAKFIRDYMDKNAGPHPVYSASLLKPFGFVNEHDYEGHFLTWVMNGYGGRVQEVAGKFCANRDRGVLVPREGVETPDLTYVRYTVEPLLVASAVGRRVDGRANDYTKIYPTEAGEVQFAVPVTPNGKFDYSLMASLGNRYRKVEVAQARVVAAAESIRKASFPVNPGIEAKSVSLGDETLFKLSIGDRVLVKDHVTDGVPVYSANARTPFGFVEQSNLKDFENYSLIWGIDGIFDWSLIQPGVEFATTDHCGRLQVLTEKIDPNYLFHYLRATRTRHGFDRVYRASLTNVRSDVSVDIPFDKGAADFDLQTQQAVAAELDRHEKAKARALALLDEVARARVLVE